MDVDDWTVTTADSVPFAHPRSWQPSVERSEEGTSVFLESDGVSFGIVGVYPLSQDPDEIVDQVLESVRDEHPGLEVESLDLDEDPYPDAVAREGLFMTLDTVAYCWIRSWRLAHRSIVVYVQSIEPESADGEEIFEAICQSILRQA